MREFRRTPGVSLSLVLWVLWILTIVFYCLRCLPSGGSVDDEVLMSPNPMTNPVPEIELDNLARKQALDPGGA